MRLLCFSLLFLALWFSPGTIPTFAHTVSAYAGHLLAFVLITWFLSDYLHSFLNRFVLDHVNPEGKAVLVTDCDTGIGHLAALFLNHYGFTVIAACLNPHSSNALKLKQRSKYPERMVLLKLDVTKDEELEAVYTKVLKYMDNGLVLWGLVNNADLIKGFYTDWDDLDSTYKRTTDVNYLSPVRVTRKFLNLLRNTRGRVVNISSAAALTNPVGLSAYAISKAALSIFSDVLRLEMRPFGIQSITIFSADQKTKLFGSLFGESWSETSSSTKEDYGDKLAGQLIERENQRWSEIFVNQPEKVAQAILESLTFHSPASRRTTFPVFQDKYFGLYPHLPPEAIQILDDFPRISPLNVIIHADEDEVQ